MAESLKTRLEKAEKDYMPILEKARNSSNLLNDVCEGKTTFTQEVENIEILTNEKYRGFWNFWKPYRALDKDYNAKVKNLENALGIETKKIKTGKTTEAIVEYIGLELATDIFTALFLLTSYAMGKLPMPENHSISLEFLKYANIYGLLGFAIGLKYFLSPQLLNRRDRKKTIKSMKADAVFVDSITKEVYQK